METRTRSPRYPNINLQEAIEKARIIYAKEHTHKASREVIAKDLGYTGINGASATMISSIRQFGLLEGIGDSMKISEDATIILELPPGDPERIEAIRRAAFTPKLFGDIYVEYGDKLPSDENLRLFLVKLGFNSKAANSVIRAYRETLSIVKSETEGYNEESDSFDVGNTAMTPNRNTVTADLNRAFAPKSAADLLALIPQGNFSEDLHYRVSDDCKARVMFEGTVTQEAIKKLIAYLQLGIDDFPSKARTVRQELDEQQERKMLPENT